MLFGGTTEGTAQGSRYRAQGKNSKESGPKGPGFGQPPEEAPILFPPGGSLLE